MDPNDLKLLIRAYFEAGYAYSLILRFLKGLHGITISLRTLKRLLRKMGLRRRGLVHDFVHVSESIQVQVELGQSQ